MNNNNLKLKPETQFSNDDRVRLVLEGLKGRKTIEEICREANLHPELFYKWSNDFIKAGSSFITTDPDANYLSEINQTLQKQNLLLEKLIEKISIT